MKLDNQQINWIRQFVVLCAMCSILCASSCRMNKNKNARRDKIDQDSLKTDFFQNLTSKYNILYNANLMLDAEQKAIFQATDKNYQIRLSVFDEPAANGDPHKTMDSLIQKAYKVVNVKQESKYINDAYFLIGRANYFKGSYYTAVEFFDKLINDNSANQKPLKALAYAWKSRALLQINKIELAGKAVDSAFMFVDENKATRTFVNAAKANHLIRTGQENKAVPFLEYSITSNKQMMDTYRWKFLIAQLYRDAGEVEKAEHIFSELTNANISFDMAFEAGLQAAYLKGDKFNGTVEQRVKPFRSMLKEGKNEGYQDQVLFEIGKIYLSVNDEENAMKFFQQSLQKNDKNVFQATDTYLTVADYFFDKQQYQKAQLYYDSTAAVLPANYTDVNKVRRKLTFMSALTPLYEENLWQDTLLSLAKMEEVERVSKVTAFAEKSLAVAEEQVLQKNKLAKSKNGKVPKIEHTRQVVINSFADNTRKERTASPGNTFYFNNQDALLLGAAEFKRKWGNRQLKDDWRFFEDHSLSVTDTLSPKISETAALASSDTLDAFVFVESYTRKYLDSVPLTAEDFQRRQQVVHDNMIVIGNIYRDYTRDYRDAIQAYELFLERFPNTEAGAEIYYSLFRMYENIDEAKSIRYKNKLIALYPTSLHASVAKDRYYLDKVNRDKRVLDRAFEKLFTLYTAGDHVAVIKMANETLSGVASTSSMAAQIAYLKALAIGRVGRLSDFTFALGQIVQKYPNDSLVVPLAVKNIAFIDSNPSMFIHRVNALQDKDKLRTAFLEEPNMTPWPTLYIYGDYRTAVAINNESPKVEEDVAEAVLLAEEPIKPIYERSEIELLLANELEKGGSTVNLAGASDKKVMSLGEMQDRLLVKPEKPRKESDAVAKTEAESRQARVELIANASVLDFGGNDGRFQTIRLNGKAVDIGEVKINFGPNEYRDKKLFPDTATYYFTINVLDPRVNLAPSRYGIGQFNRSRYARASINHQLKLVDAENQLLFIGPFETFEEVKTYETRILPLLPEIMKVPQEDYNSFVITSEVLGTLTDGIQIKNYHQVYIEQ